MVIVLFGIGTDYNILLYDKFKENLGKGMDKYKAMHNALYNAGKTILYSGSSILIGFTALSLAKFSVYQSAVGVCRWGRCFIGSITNFEPILYGNTW